MLSQRRDCKRSSEEVCTWRWNQRSHQNLFLKPLLVKNGLERAKKGKNPAKQQSMFCINQSVGNHRGNNAIPPAELQASTAPSPCHSNGVTSMEAPAYVHLDQIWVLLLPNPVLLCQTTKRCGSMVLLAAAIQTGPFPAPRGRCFQGDKILAHLTS